MLWMFMFAGLNVTLAGTTFFVGHVIGGAWIESVSATHVMLIVVTCVAGALFIADSREATRRLPRIVGINRNDVPRWVIAASLWFAGIGIAPAIIALGISGPPVMWHDLLAIAYPLAWWHVSKTLSRIAPEAEAVG